MTTPSHPSSHPHLDLKAVAARILRHLAHQQSKGRLVRLDQLACDVGVRRADVRQVVARLHAEGHVDAQRMRLTMTGLALVAAMRKFELREARVAKRPAQSLVA
jgi:DNA-binding MarR family transcriptional regulator